MNKKEVLEIRKQFTPANCAISHICGCYVDYEKNKVLTSRDAFLSLPEEEEYKYFDIFKHALGGNIGKNLLTMEFPLDAELMAGNEDEDFEGRPQALWYLLRESKLQDDALLERFYDRIIESYDFEDNYYIVLIHASYDVPGKAMDGSEMFDASENVYDFLLCCLCPVKLSKAGLAYNGEKNCMEERIRDRIVDYPVNAMLFPAFEDRIGDIHKILYYAKNPEIVQLKLMEDMLGGSDVITPAEQKESFHEVLTATLEQNGDFDTVRSIHESMTELVEENSGEPDPVLMDRHDIKVMLRNSGIADEDLDYFEEMYTDKVGEDEKLMLSNIAETKKFEVSMPDVVIRVDPQKAYLIETMEINGRQCIVIPADGNVEVNGVSVRVRKKDDGTAELAE